MNDEQAKRVLTLLFKLYAEQEGIEIEVTYNNGKEKECIETK